MGEKSLVWVGQSKKDLLRFPDDVVDAIGFALGEVQNGRMPKSAKVLQGFGGASVMEIVADDSSGTFRAVYTVKFEDATYVLHCFQKKSTQGIKTSTQDMDLVRARLAWAEEISNEWKKSQGKK
ncbi:MAG: type II toxin-antitoxin system RelE/ParE family toxin [Pirellula sp.]